MTVDGQKIDVIKIPVQRRPFFLKKDYAKLKAGVVYFRQGTTTDQADPDEIAAMGEDAVALKTSEPELHLQFAELQPSWLGGQSYRELGEMLDMQLKLLDPSLLQTPLYPNLEFIGEFGKPKKESDQFDALLKKIDRSSAINDAMRGFHFAVSNHGQVPALNVEAHLMVPRGTGLIVATQAQVFPKEFNSLDDLLENTSKAPENELHCQTKVDFWQLTFRFERILPNYTAFSKDMYYFGATQSGSWKLDGTSYGDNLSSPNKSTLKINIEARA